MKTFKTGSFTLAFGAILAVWASASATSHAATDRPILNMMEFTFSDLGGVTSWKKGSDTVVFIKNRANSWYKAEMKEPCMAYDTKQGINFIVETDPTTNSRTNAVVVERKICRVTSIVKVASPEMPTTSAK